MPPVPVIVPEKVVLELSPPEVSVKLPKLIFPAPAIEPTSSSDPNVYVAPLSTVTGVELLRLPFTVNEPAEILVAPVYVLAPVSYTHLTLPTNREV